MPKERKKNEKRSRREEVKIGELVLTQPHTYQLMQINPEITMNALTYIEESGKFEEFVKHAKTLGMKPGNLRALNSVRELNEMLTRVTNTVRLVAGSCSTMGYFCEHLIRSTKKCQAFIRKALEKRRREKSFAKARWLSTQERARRLLELVVKDRVKRLKSSQSQNLLEETWGVLIDCYISPEDMNAAIDSYFKEASLRYLTDFRQYRKQARATALSCSELYSTQRRKLREAILKYPAMCEVVCLTPPVNELCVHLDHIHNFASQAMVRRGSEEEDPKNLKKRPHVFAPAANMSPVSYYHALITLSPREDFQLLLALRALNSGADPKSLNRINGPSRQVIQRAWNLKQKWMVLHGKPLLSSSQGTREAIPKLDENGQPKSCIDCGAVAKRRASPKPPDAERLGTGRKEAAQKAARLSVPFADGCNSPIRPTGSASHKPKVGSIFGDASSPKLRNSGSRCGSSSGGRINAMWEMALQNHSARVEAHRLGSRCGGRSTELPIL